MSVDATQQDDITELEAELVRWVVDYNEEEGLGCDEEIGPETDLFETGALDSMGFVGLIAVFEALSGVEVDFDEIEPEELNTVRAIIERCR
jgi:acyl carrier protein